MTIEKTPGAIDAVEDSNQEVQAEETNQGLEAAEVPETEQSEEQKTEGEEVKRKKPSGYMRKIAKLQRELAEERARNASQQPAVKTENLNKPQLTDYKTYDEYNEALTDWKVDQKLKSRDEEAKKQKEAEKQREATSTWEKKVDALGDEYADYEEVVGQYRDYHVNPAITQVLAESDIGPQLAYYLAKNPDKLEEINNKTPYAVAKEMAKIEASLNQPSVKVSKSPAPIRPVKGSSKSTVSLADVDTDTFISMRMNRKK